MRKFAIALAGILFLAVAGCSTSGDDVSVEEVSPEEVASTGEETAETAEEALGTGNTVGVQSFSEPIVAQPPRSSLASAELIQPTNAEARLDQIRAQQSRPDPFASLPIPPPAEPEPEATTEVAQVPQVTPLSNNGGTSAGDASGGNRSPARANTPASDSSSGTSGLPTLPALPQPNLALGVGVTGVVQVKGMSLAIVKAPDEPTSRYVRVGQRLSNGRILVKRIELRQGADPVVIFEQNGIEVAKVVGEGAQDISSATAALEVRTQG
ncbi:MAG: hypothetical protein F6K19_00405 [Cyanothece sp. SIO1E1]|nr:hypothetical protein [Cyanothece sp. SIO1E1]